MAKQLNVNLAVTANTQQAKQQLQQLQQTLSSLTTNSANLKIGLDQTQLQQASKQLLELQAHLKAATNVDTGALDFTKLNNSIRNSGKTLTQYGQQLLALGPQGKEAFAQLAQSVAQSEVPIRRLSGLLGQFGTVLKNTIRWQISSSLIHGFMGSIQQAYGYAQDLNKSLNNIQIVTGLSDNQMAKFAKTANTAAKALSTTTTKYTDAALIYYQQGIRSEKEIKQRTDVTTKMANVTGQTAENVSNQMTAIWNNFADGSKNLEYYADVITALGAATASSSEEISRGLQKFAAIADTVGLSYENATAALATITATTRQSADTVGTGLRTLFSRLQSLSLGETLEDGVNLTKYSKALATVGVNALDAQGQLRSMDDVISDLGNKWQSLSKAQQTALAQTVGGVRQYTTLVALMDNFDFYKQNLDVAKTSEGTLQKQQAIYEKSWKASADRVKAAAETIYSSLINDQFFIKLNDGFAGFLDILNNIITGLGGMKGLLLGIGGVMTNVFSGQIAQGMYNFGIGIRNLAQTPSRQRDERAAFINNAAGLMAGGTYDARTNTVTNVPNNNGPFSLVGQYTAMLQHQAAFSGNAQYMTAQQKQMAQMALDNETKAYQDYQQKRLIQQQNLAAQQDRASVLKNQVNYSGRPEASQIGFDLSTKMIDTASAAYNQRMNLINQVRESGTIDGLTQDDLIALFGVGFTAKDIKNWTPEDLTVELNKAQQQAKDDFGDSREAFVQNMANFGIDRNRAEAYANGQQVLGQSNFDVSNSQRRAEQARRNAEEAAGLSSKGLRAATGLTNLASGVMSGIAVSTQWDQANKAIEQFKAGTLSTKDAVTQVTSSLAGMGINGAMAFSSMTKAVQAFGVKSAAAAGWIGAALTVITLLAPKVIDLFDKMHTTDAEIGEQLTAGVEQATNSAEEAKQAYDNLINGFNTHSSLLDTLNDLTEGTLEFKKALLEANDEATKLIQDYDIDSSGWYYNDKGAIEFTAEAEKAMAEKYYKQQLQATAEKNVAGLISGLFERDQAIKGIVEAYSGYVQDKTENLVEEAAPWYGSDAKEKYLKLAQDTYKSNNPNVFDFTTGGDLFHETYQPTLTGWWNKYQKDQESAYKKALNNNPIADLFEWFARDLETEAILGSSDPWSGIQDNFKNWSYYQDYIGPDAMFHAFDTFEDAKDAYIKFVDTSKSIEDGLLALRQSAAGPEFIRQEYMGDEATMELLANNPELATSFKKYSGFDINTVRSVYNVVKALPTLESITEEFEAGKAAYTSTAPFKRNEQGKITFDQYGNPQFDINNINWEEIVKAAGITYSDIGFDNLEQLVNAIKTEQALGKKSKYDFTTETGLTNFLLDQSQIRTANVSDNKLALSSARMAMTGQTLSATENFVTDILSQQTNQIADIKETSKILAGTSYDLTQQNITEDDIANIIPDVVKEVRKTEGYKAAEDKNEYVRNAVFQKQFTEALQKKFNDAYQEAFYDTNTKLPTLNKSLLDNWQSLTLTEFTGAMQAAFGQIYDADTGELINPNEKAVIDETVGSIIGDFITAAQQANFDTTQESVKQALEKNVTLGDFITASTIPSIFNTTYGEKTAELVAQKIYEPLLKGDTTMLKVFEQFQSTGSTITDLANIKAGKTSLGASELASDVYDSILSEAGEKGLFEELYNSEDFAEGLKSLRKELKKTGSIGADSLVALAEQSELLSNYLEVSGVNVQGLADALNLLETGKIDSMSSALLAALSAAGAVNSNLAQTYAYIDNFQEERSIQDIGAFMKKRADTIQAGFSSGMLLDAPLLQSMEALFGTDMRSQYQKDIYDWTGDQNFTPEQISKLVNDKYADQIAAMKSIQERGNLSGMFEYYEQQNPNGGMFSYNKQTGQVIAIDQDQLIKNGWQSQDAFIQGLQDNYGMSETMARAMASEYAATNGNIAQLWRTTAANQGMTALTETAKDEILTGDEARAFYNQYKDVLTDYTEESFLAKIAKDAKAAGKEFIDLGKDFDIATASFEELQNRYEAKKGKGSFKDYLGLPKDGGVVTDLDAVKQKLVDLGMTSAKANTEIDKLIDNGEIKLFDNTTTEGAQTEKEFADFRALNKEIKSTTEAWEAFQQKKKEQAESDEIAAQQQALITNAIKDAAKALGEEGIDIPLNPRTEELEKALADKEVNVTLHVTNPDIIPKKASGYNNAGFAGGKHSNGQYEGLAEVGELGPELFIHDGQPYLAGIHGRTKAYVHKDDQIYTAAQTQKILNDNPSLQDIPGFSVGYNQVSWGDTSATAGNNKTSKWEPERYHVITRQLKDLQREYDRLSKIKDNCYGTNKLEAIQKEIDATDQLIVGQKKLIEQAENYLKSDTDRLRGMLSPDEFQIDENGNLLNFEELQQKYRKKAEEDKDEKAQDIWKALTQYEETLDKLKDSQTELQDLVYQQMDLRLETITTKVDMKVNFDEREIKLLDHYIKRIDDNIYHTAEVLALTSQKLGNINQKISDTREGINGLFKELSDSEGKLIRKEDGSAYTMEEWLALSNEQRDMLDMNGKFGEQLEEYMDSLLDYIEELEEFKTKGVEEFGEAFDKLNDNVRSSIDLFNHYNQLLSDLKDITDLQGVKLSAEMKSAMKEIDAAMFQNTQNNIQAELDYYKTLQSDITDLRTKINNTTDESLKLEWEEQLKKLEEEARTSEKNLTSLWKTGLQQAKDDFERDLNEAVEDYEAAIAGAYGSLDELQMLYEKRKRNRDAFVPDFEKQYQITKLQTAITADLANQQKNGFKQSEGLKKLQNELNEAHKSGVKLSEYDLDIYSKRYNYEKALMDLEDSRNAKSQVRLQRDANGNWGYVYTSNVDEDELLKKQQAINDALYEWQKSTQTQVDNTEAQLLTAMTEAVANIKDLRAKGATDEAIKEALGLDIENIKNTANAIVTATDDAYDTLGIAKERYQDAEFEITDSFSETLLSGLMGDDSIDGFLEHVTTAITTANEKMVTASSDYDTHLKAINDFFNESGEDLSTVIKGFASIINSESDENLIDSKEQIKNAKDTFDEILKVASDFEKEFINIYQPIIDENERLVGDLLKALHALNREEYAWSGDSSKGKTITDIIGDITPIVASTTSPKQTQPPKQEDEPPTSNGTPKNYRKPEELIEDLASRLRQAIIDPRFPWQDKIQIAKMDNGGYTGTWGSDGRLAILHEKEEVFSKDDTLRLLNAAEILRRIDLQADLMSKGISNFNTIDRGLTFNKANDLLEQMVTITAEFPNATNHSEIEEAFTNLINKASQYANRKGI